MTIVRTKKVQTPTKVSGYQKHYMKYPYHSSGLFRIYPKFNGKIEMSQDRSKLSDTYKEGKNLGP